MTSTDSSQSGNDTKAYPFILSKAEISTFSYGEIHNAVSKIPGLRTSASPGTTESLEQFSYDEKMTIALLREAKIRFEVLDSPSCRC